MKKRKILFIGLIVILGILGTVRVLICKYVPVTIVRIPQEIKFTNEYNPDAYLCLPAAYTSVDDTIEGSYRVDGKINGSKSLKEYISIHPTKGLLIGNKWYSNNGFQQHILVKNYKARRFKDTRKRYRRALCDECDGSASYLIIESTYPMTLSDFAQEVSHYCYNAVNLDMGDYGYGWIGKSKHTRWAKYNQNKPHGLSAISHNKRYLPSSLRLPRVPLGGSATSRTPLAAVAARGAEDNINDDVENVDKVLLVSGIFREKCCLGATLL